MNEFEAAFQDLADGLCGGLADSEVLLLNLTGEASDFARFNRGRLRSAGSVLQRNLRIELRQGNRAAGAALQLSGDAALDLERGLARLRQLRERLPALPEDPFLNYSVEIHDTRQQAPNRLPPAVDAAEDLLRAAHGLDLVGSLAAGEMFYGFANSLGQRNWHSDFSFLADWSVYDGEDAAVKQSYEGEEWNSAFIDAKLDYAADTLERLKRRPRQLSPGRYRVFLAPAALYDLMKIAGADGFGLKSLRSRHAALLALGQGRRRLDTRVALEENHAGGRAPRFTTAGFIKPEKVELLREGRFGEALTGARSACEYGETVNCEVEQPQSLELAGGELHQDDILAALGTGIYVSNVWYCNLSDRRHCRITGLTRFACLWVENGEPVAPISVMRFDESLYRILGEGLLALTSEHEQIFDSGTYERRSEGSARLPGALVEGFTLTL